MKTRILVLHPDPEVLQQVTSILETEGLEVRGARLLRPILAGLVPEPPDVALVGAGLEDASEDELWRELERACPDAVGIALTPGEQLASALATEQAEDFVPEPIDARRLIVSVRLALARRRLERQVASLGRKLFHAEGLEALIPRSDAMRRAVELLRRAATTEVPLLIHGPAGSPLREAARAVHEESSRAEGPFVSLDCAAQDAGRLPAELLGYERGALPGADAPRAGALEQASGGTLLLDHIEHVDEGTASRLLHALSARSAARLFGSQPHPADVRLIATTRFDPVALLEHLQSDLGLRLGVLAVELPALAQRRADLPALAWSILRRLARVHQREVGGLTAAATAALEAHAWPGDVRELEAVLERALLLESGPRLDVYSLPAELLVGARPTATTPAEIPATPGPLGPRNGEGSASAGQLNGISPALLPPGTVLPFQELERRILLHALRATGWNVQEAARRLKLGRATIYRKIERYGLKREAG